MLKSIFCLINIFILIRGESQDSMDYTIDISQYTKYAQDDCNTNNVDFSQVISIPVFRLNKPNSPFKCGDDICKYIGFSNNISDQLILVSNDKILTYYKLVDSSYIKIMSPMIPSEIVYNKYIANKSFLNTSGIIRNLDITKLYKIISVINKNYYEPSYLIFLIYGCDEIFYWHSGKVYVVLMRGNRIILKDSNKYFLNNYSIDYLNHITEDGLSVIGYLYKTCDKLQRSKINDQYINLDIR